MTSGRGADTIAGMGRTSQQQDTLDEVRARYGAHPFRLSHAIRDGMPRGRLRSAIGSGALVRLRRDVYELAGAWESDPRARHLALARAAQLVVPGSVASHGTAALAHRLPAPTRRDAHPYPPTLTHPTRSERRTDLRLVAGCLDARDVTTIEELIVTAVARTGLDVALGRPLTHALVVLDAAARQLLEQRHPGDDVDRLASDSALRDTVLARFGGAAGRRADPAGAAQLATAIALTDPRSESPLESWSRAVLLEAGVSRPRLQLPVRGESGRWYRADLGWPEQRVLGEADGLVKYTELAALHAEKRREDDLRRAGWVVVRWTWAELVRNPSGVVARLARELTRS